MTNEQRSAAEVAAFKADTPGPYFAYHAGPAFRPRGERMAVGRRITTWMNDDLAAVIEAGDTFRSAFGDTRQNFRALGINGVTYAGTAYLSAGDYVRMRAVKS